MEEEDEGQDDVTHCFFYKHTVYKHASLKIAYILSTSQLIYQQLFLSLSQAQPKKWCAYKKTMSIANDDAM